MDANTHILAFRLGSDGYGLQLDQVARVVQSVECAPLPGAPAIVAGIINYHGQIVPVLNIRKRLGLAAREIGVEDYFIIAAAFGRAVAIVVDRVDGVIVRSADGNANRLGEGTHRSERLDGVASLADELTLISDLNQCMSEAEQQMLGRALAEYSGDGELTFTAA